MSDISKINVDGIDYDLKDKVARDKLESLMSFSIDVSTDEQLIEALQKVYDSTENSDLKIGRIYIKNESATIPGGHWLAILSNTWGSYGFVICIKYNSNGIPQFRYINYWNSTWGNWETIRPLPKVTTADNGKILKVVDGAWMAVSN